MLDIGPAADGTIPVIMQQRLMEIGNWLKVNGEAIYGTRSFIRTKQDEGINPGANKNVYFTQKDNNLYVTVLDWPGEKVLIKSFSPKGNTWAGLYPSEIASVTMLGDNKELKWEMTKEGLIIQTPKTRPCDYAYVFRIIRRNPFK